MSQFDRRQPQPAFNTDRVMNVEEAVHLEFDAGVPSLEERGGYLTLREAAQAVGCSVQEFTAAVLRQSLGQEDMKGIENTNTKDRMVVYSPDLVQRLKQEWQEAQGMRSEHPEA